MLTIKNYNRSQKCIALGENRPSLRNIRMLSYNLNLIQVEDYRTFSVQLRMMWQHQRLPYWKYGYRQCYLPIDQHQLWTEISTLINSSDLQAFPYMDVCILCNCLPGRRQKEVKVGYVHIKQRWPAFEVKRLYYY